MLDWYPPFHQNNIHHFARKADMVRVTGIRTHLDICVTPKSRFCIKLIMFQSNLDMSDIGEDTPDNWRWRNEEFPQGGYDTNAHIFTQAHKNVNDQIEVAIHPHYSELFDF
jgi:hypothetical protein